MIRSGNDALQAACGKKIISTSDIRRNVDEVLFTFEDGSRLRIFHQQDCCENVYLDDFEGSEADLVNQLLVSAESPSGEFEDSIDGGVVQWTFYNFRTTKGDLSLRWIGSSNGYYSTSMSVEWYPADVDIWM